MSTRILAGAALLAVLVALPSPAQAIPTLPGPGPEYLAVTTYKNNSGTIVGQKWHGCGQPPGSWGVTSTHPSLGFVLCS